MDMDIDIWMEKFIYVATLQIPSLSISVFRRYNHCIAQSITYHAEKAHDPITQ